MEHISRFSYTARWAEKTFPCMNRQWRRGSEEEREGTEKEKGEEMGKSGGEGRWRGEEKEKGGVDKEAGKQQERERFSSD